MKGYIKYQACKLRVSEIGITRPYSNLKGLWGSALHGKSNSVYELESPSNFNNLSSSVLVCSQQDTMSQMIKQNQIMFMCHWFCLLKLCCTVLLSWETSVWWIFTGGITCQNVMGAFSCQCPWASSWKTHENEYCFQFYLTFYLNYY
jgi:hypothetical protein